VSPIPVQVQCHAGFKADESPRRFLGPGLAVEVEAVVDRWLAAGRDPRQPAADYFKVRGHDGQLYLLRHDRGSDAWFLVER
jgi:hypothetical protein